MAAASGSFLSPALVLSSVTAKNSSLSLRSMEYLSTTVPPILWHQVVREAASLYRRDGEAARIILIGHSVGAFYVYRIAESLGRRNVPVDLVIGLDPNRELEVSQNVIRAVNYFLTPEVSHVVPGPGFSGQLVNMVVGDITTLAHRDIILDEDIRHRTREEIRRAIAD